jgi:FdhE protein
VLRNPLNKLLDRRKPLRPDAERALAQLAQLAEQRPDLSALATTHAALLGVAFRDTPPAPQLQLDPAHALTKAAAGVPLLRGEPIALDSRWLRERYLQLCAALKAQPGGHPAAAVDLTQALRRGALDMHALALDVLAGDPGAVAQQAARLGLDAGLAATLLRWTLLPLLEQSTIQLRPLLEQSDWQQGYCPVCGAWPILAEQRGIEQRRFLRCGLCASDWSSERLLCPFCGSRSPGDMAYLYEEQQEATQRAVTCERCHCYYKSIATLTPLSAPQLLVADLATLHLDLVALERAYAPPA